MLSLVQHQPTFREAASHGHTNASTHMLPWEEGHFSPLANTPHVTEIPSCVYGKRNRELVA